MTVTIGADVVALIVLCFVASFVLGALIAYLLEENHYHH